MMYIQFVILFVVHKHTCINTITHTPTHICIYSCTLKNEDFLANHILVPRILFAIFMIHRIVVIFG